MNKKQLEILIQESIRQALESRKEDMRMREGFFFKNGQASTTPKFDAQIDQAVNLAVQCAKVLKGEAPKPANVQGSVLQQCFDDILKLFLKPNGDFVDPNLDPNSLKTQFLSQLPATSPVIKKTADIILSKVVDKLSVNLAENKKKVKK